MPPPRRLHLHLHAAYPFLFQLPVILLLLATREPGVAAASALSTFALATADATTIVCALLPSAASPLLVDLNCTAAGGDHARQETYPSSHPFAALAGGEDFLCAVGPSGERAGDVDMRWWDLSTSGDGSRSKRVYMGPLLRALSSGEYRVCGVLGSGELHCWRWRGLNISHDLRFVAVAVGDGFVCGILRATPASIRCFGNDTSAADVVTGAPKDGSFDVVAASGHRACALSTTGALTCWGRDPPQVEPAAGAAGYAALALGDAGVCGLRTNFTILCFGDGVAHPPAGLARAQFLDVRAHGRSFCGVLMANYSLVCRGDRGRAHGEDGRLPLIRRAGGFPGASPPRGRPSPPRRDDLRRWPRIPSASPSSTRARRAWWTPTSYAARAARAGAAGDLPPLHGGANRRPPLLRPSSPARQLPTAEEADGGGGEERRRHAVRRVLRLPGSASGRER